MFRLIRRAADSGIVDRLIKRFRIVRLWNGNWDWNRYWRKFLGNGFEFLGGWLRCVGNHMLGYPGMVDATPLPERTVWRHFAVAHMPRAGIGWLRQNVLRLPDGNCLVVITHLCCVRRLRNDWIASSSSGWAGAPFSSKVFGAVILIDGLDSSDRTVANMRPAIVWRQGVVIGVQ